MVAQQNETKSVTFCGQVRVRHALHINDYSDDEIDATWFNAAGMKRIRKELRYTMDLMQQEGAEIDEVKYSSRGLEYQVAEGAYLRKKNRIDAVDAVLDEQDEQRREGVVDEEMLAMEYGNCTSRSQLAAQVIGRLDQKIASGLSQKGDDSSRITMDSINRFFGSINQRRQQ
jgi:hypothetical protein